MVAQILSIKEHASLLNALAEKSITLPVEQWYPTQNTGKHPFLFGIDFQGNVGFHIGLDWLKVNELALEVKPKIKDIDFMAMFHKCLSSRKMLSYLGGTYHIDVDKPLISTNRPHFEINAIISLHFLKLLQDLIQRPLKNDYIQRNENLTARIKGKIDLPNHLRFNILGQRPDRVYCKYQEYSVDCLENRLLNSAFGIALNYLQTKQKLELPAHLNNTIPAIRQTFSSTGLINSLSELNKIKANPLYKEYGEALRLAKLLYRIRGYKHESSDQKKYNVPPYSINMALIFEMYVYQFLSELTEFDILPQHPVNSGIPDFLDTKNRWILDAKYKTWYKDPACSNMIEDIRQLSGYSRDEEVHRILHRDILNEVIPCIIIYPDITAPSDLSNFKQRMHKIPCFTNFHKVGIKLPLKESSL